MKRRDFLKLGGLVGLFSLLPFPIPAFRKEEFRPEKSLPILFKKGKKQVFVDWWFVEPGYGMPFWKSYQEKYGTLPWFSPYGIKLTLNRPVLQEEPFLTEDPLGQIGAYCTLMYDKGLYRFWYETYGREAKGDEGAKICYMESEDGRNWRRPRLGLIEYRGSRANNIVYGYGPPEKGGPVGGHGASIFKDPSAPPNQRYKLVHLGRAGKGAHLADWLYGAVSPDGIDWRILKDPILKYTSDTQTVGLYDEELGKYVLYLRGWSPQDALGFGGRRIVRRSESKDFSSFPPPEDVLTPQPWWDPWTDIYTNAYHRWPGAQDAHIMMPALYHRNSDMVEVYFAVSRDGKRWSLFPQPFISSRDVPGSVSIYVGRGIVPYGRGRWAFPVFISEKAHNEYRRKKRAIYLATIREDGFICVETELKGEFYTFPFRFEGGKLLLNASTLPGGQIRVGLLEVKNRREAVEIKGFSLEDCNPLKGDILWKEVSWKGTSDISRFQGKVLRLRFELVRGKIYSFKFL